MEVESEDDVDGKRLEEVLVKCDQDFCGRQVPSPSLGKLATLDLQLRGMLTQQSIRS